METLENDKFLREPTVFSSFGFSLHDKFSTGVAIWVDCFHQVQKTDADTKVFVQMEPHEVNRINYALSQYYNQFDYVLTYEEDLLAKLPNAVCFPFGTTWISESEIIPEKEFSVSMVAGPKLATVGHRLRRKIWDNQERITIPKNFFVSRHGGVRVFEGNYVFDEFKMPLFKSMFHVCVENVTKDHYFSEKICDAFMCESIPIYWGCRKLDEYFNMDGVIRVNDVNEAVAICNSLTPEDYHKRREAILDNKERVKRYTNYNERLVAKLKELGVE